MTDEPSRENEPSNPNGEMRMLNIDISGGKFSEVDGGLMVKEVLVLDEGTWTDSKVKSALFYPAKTLEASQSNWKMNSIWTRHSGGSPRSVTDKVGRVVNPRFLNTGIVADLFFHSRTQASKDTAEMVRSGDINAVSVEHGGSEEYNPTANRWEAKTLQFFGLAMVDRGACETCVIRKQEAAPIEVIPEVAGGITMDEKMLGEKFAEFEARMIKALDEKIAGIKPAEIKVDEKMLSEVENVKKELGIANEKILALEKAPRQLGSVAGNEEVPMKRIVGKADMHMGMGEMYRE